MNSNRENIDLNVIQRGVTLAIQSNILNQKVSIRPNITIQNTEAKNYSPYSTDQGAYDKPQDGIFYPHHKGVQEDITAKQLLKLSVGLT